MAKDFSGFREACHERLLPVPSCGLLSMLSFHQLNQTATSLGRTGRRARRRDSGMSLSLSSSRLRRLYRNG